LHSSFAFINKSLTWLVVSKATTNASASSKY
jgi:hypothetical protein